MKSIFMQTNRTNNSLYCVYSKEKIHIGERYIVASDEYCGDIIEKAYKKEYINFILAENE